MQAVQLKPHHNNNNRSEDLRLTTSFYGFLFNFFEKTIMYERLIKKKYI